jgi:hypothetical protein
MGAELGDIAKDPTMCTRIGCEKPGTWHVFFTKVDNCATCDDHLLELLDKEVPLHAHHELNRVRCDARGAVRFLAYTRDGTSMCITAEEVEILKAGKVAGSLFPDKKLNEEG